MKLMMMMLPWIIMLISGEVMAQTTQGHPLLRSGTFKDSNFIKKNNLPLDLASTNTFVNPINSDFCTRRLIGSKLDPSYIVTCELKDIEGSVVSPYTYENSTQVEFLHYNRAMDLHLVKPCSVVYVDNSTLTSYTDSVSCTKSLMLRDSRSHVLFGKFHDLRIHRSNITTVSVDVIDLDVRNVNGFNIKINQEHNYLHLLSISKSIFHMMTLNCTSPVHMNDTAISRLGIDQTLHYKGTHDISNLINGCTIDDMVEDSVVVERGSTLVIQNTTIGILGSSAIFLAAGSTLHLKNVVIHKASYGAFLVHEPSVLTMYNVTVAGKRLTGESGLIHRVDINTHYDVELSEDGVVCSEVERSITCDLGGSTEGLRIGWMKPLNNLFLMNASNVTITYDSAQNFTVDHLSGKILSSNMERANSPGNMTINNSNFTAVHIKMANKLEMTNVSVKHLMLENISHMVWNNVQVSDVDLLSIAPRTGHPSIWNHVQINTLSKITAFSPLLIDNSKFLVAEDHFILDHPGQRTKIVNTYFFGIHRRGIHLKRGELELTNISLTLLLPEIIYVEQGAKLILGNLGLPPNRRGLFSSRIISVDTLDQVEYATPADHDIITGRVMVRRLEDTPGDHHFSVSPDLSQCSPGHLPNMLECNFTQDPQSRVFVGSLRHTHLVFLRVSGAQQVTAHSPCVSVLFFENIGYVDLLEDSMDCVESLLLVNSHVSQVVENTSKLHAENITTALVQMGEHSKTVELDHSTIERVVATPDTFRCVGSTIGTLDRVIVNDDVFIDGTTIDDIAHNGLVIGSGATAVINNTFITALHKHSLNVLGRLIVENTTILVATNSSIVLYENSHTVFKNVNMSHFAIHSLSYRLGAQITFINVTINGHDGMIVFQQLVMVAPGKDPLVGDDSPHFQEDDQQTANPDWFAMEILPKLSADTNTTLAVPSLPSPFYQPPAVNTTTTPSSIIEHLSVETTPPRQSIVINIPEHTWSDNGEEFEAASTTDSNMATATSTVSTPTHDDAPTAIPNVTVHFPSNQTKEPSSPSRQSADTLQKEYPEPMVAVGGIIGLLVVAGIITGLAFVVKRSYSPDGIALAARFSGGSDTVTIANQDDVALEQQQPTEDASRNSSPDFAIVGSSDMPTDPFHRQSVVGTYFNFS